LKKINSLYYSGRSMAGTFKECDRIEIDKCRLNEIKIGDVAIFISPLEEEKGTRCIHRVVASIKTDFITRGDNNPKKDTTPLTQNNLIGRTCHFERNGRIHKVWNGRLGMMRAKVLHGRLHLIKVAKFFLRKPYRMLKKSGLVSKLWRPEINTIHFETQDGPLVKYVHQGRTVASCWTDTNRWWFRRPYDFVVNPKTKEKEKDKNKVQGGVAG
jgi:signal peptidase I